MVGSSRGATEKRVNIPAPDWGAVGDLNAIFDTGDVTGNLGRDSPSLLWELTALVSLHCAVTQATYS